MELETPQRSPVERFSAKAASAPVLALPTGPRRTRRWIAGLVAILLLAASVVAVRTRARKSGSEQALRTAVVTRGDFVRTLRLHGVVEAVQF